MQLASLGNRQVVNETEMIKHKVMLKHPSHQEAGMTTGRSFDIMRSSPKRKLGALVDTVS